MCATLGNKQSANMSLKRKTPDPVEDECPFRQPQTDSKEEKPEDIEMVGAHPVYLGYSAAAYLDPDSVPLGVQDDPETFASYPNAQKLMNAIVSGWEGARRKKRCMCGSKQTEFRVVPFDDIEAKELWVSQPCGIEEAPKAKFVLIFTINDF